MNDSTKYAVSSTLAVGTWQNSEILGPYSADGIRRVKGEVDGGIYVSGSGTLVRSLIADGLIDELHLFVYPLTRAGGPHLFHDDPPTKWSDSKRALRQRSALPALQGGRFVTPNQSG